VSPRTFKTAIVETEIISQAQISALNKVTLLVVKEGLTVTVLTYHYVFSCFLSAVITMSAQVVVLAVAQLITVKFLCSP
jgi:hypothetical protein